MSARVVSFCNIPDTISTSNFAKALAEIPAGITFSPPKTKRPRILPEIISSPQLLNFLPPDDSPKSSAPRLFGFPSPLRRKESACPRFWTPSTRVTPSSASKRLSTKSSSLVKASRCNHSHFLWLHFFKPLGCSLNRIRPSPWELLTRSLKKRTGQTILRI